MLIHVHIILVYCVVYIETDRQTDRQTEETEREREMAHRCIEVITETDVDAVYKIRCQCDRCSPGNKMTYCGRSR